MNPRPRKLVVAALIEREGRLLVSQRRADQSLPLHWEFPGGKIEPGESPEQALSREIREELGCEVAVGGIVEVVFHAYESFDLYMFVYRCEIREGVPRAVEVADLQWLTAGELLRRKLPPADLPLVEKLARIAG